MACSSNVFLLLMTFISLHLISFAAYDYNVGDEDGWKVPPSDDSKLYEKWASHKHFIVGDTIRFKYTPRKDSVLQVGEWDYKNCNTSSPELSSSSGNTVFKLDRSGPFYYISGAHGHCQRGQRMIVKVKSNDDESKSKSHKSSAYAVEAVLSFVVVAHFVHFPFLFQ